MGRRRGSRKLALDILYEHDVSGKDFEEIVERYASNPAIDFARTLVEGVKQNLDKLDEVIAGHSAEWSIDRMPVIDRTLLRIGLFEMLFLDEVPSAVTINEAVELAKIYSTEDSSRFVNGILGSVASSQ